MIRALRPFSLGEHSLQAGDEVTEAMLAGLPPRRFDVLVDQRYIEVAPESERIAELEAQVAKLSAPKRKPAQKKAKQKAAA